MKVSTPHTCRICKVQGSGFLDWVRFGPRHMAHTRCYLVTRPSELGKLTTWTLQNLPYGLVTELGMHAPVRAELTRRYEVRA